MSLLTNSRCRPASSELTKPFGPFSLPICPRARAVGARVRVQQWGPRGWDDVADTPPAGQGREGPLPPDVALCCMEKPGLA